MQLAGIVLACMTVQEVRIEPRAEVGPHWIFGTVRFDEEPLRGDRLDTRSDLGWTRPAVVPVVGLDVELDRHVFGVSLQVVRFHGTANFDVPRTWNESTFPADEDISARLYLDEADVEYRYAVARTETLTFEAGVRGRWFRIHMHLASPTVGGDGDNLGAFVPEAELRLAMPIGPGWLVEARVTGTSFTATGLTAHCGSVRVGPRWVLSSWFALEATFEAGLLQLVSHGKGQRNEVDLQSLGAVLSLEARF